METAKSHGNKVIQLTAGSKIWRFPPAWAPDSSKLLFGDKDLNLQFLDINTKKITVIDKARRYDLTDYSWSPDSKWPLIYNVESVDQNIDSVLGKKSALSAEWESKLLGGMTVIRGKWDNGEPLLAVPNFARLNRGGRSIVWIKDE